MRYRQRLCHGLGWQRTALQSMVQADIHLGASPSPITSYLLFVPSVSLSMPVRRTEDAWKVGSKEQREGME